jgi:hypothetical protein
VLIFDFILNRFLNFRQLSGKVVSKKTSWGNIFFSVQSFCELLFRKLFIFFISFLFRKQKQKQKNFY